MKRYVEAAESYNLPDLDNNGLLDLIDYIGFAHIKDWLYGCRVGNDLILCDGNTFVCYPKQADNVDNIVSYIFSLDSKGNSTPFDRDPYQEEEYYYRFNSLDSLIR